MSKSDNTSGVVGVMALAAVAGAAIALLFAPRKGSETRAQLKQKYYDTKQRSQDTAEDLKDKVTSSARTVRSRADEVTADVKDTVADARSQVEDAAAETRGRLRK